MTPNIARPRLSDAFDLAIPQSTVPFALPYLHEDRPFCLDPFLLWASDNPTYQELHRRIERYVETVRNYAVAGQSLKAAGLLSSHVEASELGLGYSEKSRNGTSIGPELARRIVLTFQGVPQLKDQGLSHLEVLGLIVPGIAEDRLGDLTAGLIGSWLVEFTQEQAAAHGIPCREAILPAVWHEASRSWRPLAAALPWNPVDQNAVLLAPLDLLRRIPWINYEDYYKSEYQPLLPLADRKVRRAAKEAVLAFNRKNYERVQLYIRRREAEGATKAQPHPLFEPLRLETIRRKVTELRSVTTGKADGADSKYEGLAADILTSLLWPDLDLAKRHARTDSGAHIVDVIFHNDGLSPFLQDIRDRHGARQIVWELKNVKKLEPEHVNQLYRYLDDAETGRVGVLLTRNPAPPNVLRNAVDLHSSKRFFVLCADDRSLELMLSLAESGYSPVDVIRKLYVEFTRKLPR